MGIQFFIVFVLSIAFLSMGVTGWRDFVTLTWNRSLVFSTESKFSEDLDRNIIPEELRQEFENNGLSPLSDNVTASVVDKRSRWLITNADNIPVYTIKLKEDRLYIYNESIPLLDLDVKANYLAIFQCFIGFLLFLVSLYLMGFFLYLEERESGRIMKNVKSFVKLREFLERHQKE